MSLTKNRIVSAIRGAFVADAASMGTHWIYDPSVMAKTVPSIDAPEFKDPPTPSFYSSEEFPGHYGSGMLSPYGEQLLFVTEYCASKSGGAVVDGADMSNAMLEWAKTFGGRPDHATKQFVENMEKDDDSGKWPLCGANDDQAHCFIKIVPVTCLYAGKPELRDKVVEAIKVHQNNERAIAFGLAASCILEAVLLGSSVQQALDKCVEVAASDNRPLSDEVVAALALAKSSADQAQSLEDLLLQMSHEKMKDQPDSPFYNLAARSCAMPGAFVAPVQQLFATANAESNYAQALRENILVAGDTCSRAILLGAILAAAEGGPPESWVDKMDKETLARVNAAADSIADQNLATCAVE